MDRNVIIILISLIILPWCIYVHRSRKSLGGGTIAAGYIVFALWAFMVGLPNIPVLIAPFSPPIHGKVFDAETNKPLVNCNIKAFWGIEELGIAGGHWESYQQYVTKTNAQGEFQIPRRMKILSLNGFLPALQMASHYDGTKVLAYAHGYSYSLEKINVEKQRGAWKQIDLSISMFSPSQAYLREIISTLESQLESWNVPRKILTDEDKKFLAEDYRYNFGLFTTLVKDKKSKENQATLIHYASSLSRLGDNKTAIEAYESLQDDDPDAARYIKLRIEELKRDLQR